MPPLHLLIKPASGMCNMCCQYCFYHDIVEKRSQSSYGFMNTATLEDIVKKSLLYAEESCTIAFQGGEPTLAGLPFYQRLIELQNKYNTKGLKVYNALQTNGYSLSEDWAVFFAENHFLIGISLDGTIHTNDAFRHNAVGNGTFSSVMHTIDLFKKHNVDFNILTVVNKRTAASIGKIYKFYKKQHFDFLQFIPCLDPFDVPSGTMPYSLAPKQYGLFLCELFDLWYDDFLHGCCPSIRSFDNYISVLLTGHAESCDMNGYCSIQNVVEADGEVYPCDFFVLDEYKLGNLTQIGFEEIHKRRMEIRFIDRSLEKDAECKSCRFYAICRGGCVRHRTMSGSFTERNYFCESYQYFFEHSIDRLTHAARLIAAQRR